MFMIHTESKLDEIIKRELEMERKLIIWMALKDLKPKHALIIRLKYWLNMPHDKIAAIVKSTPNCVSVTLNSIRKNLRKEMQNHIKTWIGEVKWHETH